MKKQLVHLTQREKYEQFHITNYPLILGLVSIGFIIDNPIFPPRYDEVFDWLDVNYGLHISFDKADSTTAYYYDYMIVDSVSREYNDVDLMDFASRRYNYAEFRLPRDARNHALGEAIKIIKARSSEQ